ncbi:MAG: ATP-binding protein, partial [Chloroflexota bacterium]|nr:ATP-binding protein [Chloroflexota bacterium]
ESMRLATLIRDVSIALNQSSTLPESLQKCVQALVIHLDAAFARIWTLNVDTQVLELMASAGMYTHLNGSHSRVPVGTLKIGLIASERRPHLTNEVIGDPRVSDQQWAKREGMVAFAGYPLLIEGEVVGVMALFARAPLSMAVLDAMASVSNAIALGIEHKRVEEERAHLLLAEQRAHREAEAAKQRVTDILESITDAFFTLNTAWQFTYLNTQSESLLQRKRDELLGKNIWEEFPEAVGASFYQQYHYALEQQICVVFDEFYPPLSTWIEVRAYPAPEGLSIYFHDINERKQAEEALRQSEENFRLLTASLPEIVWTATPEGLIQYYNQRWYDYTGFRPGSIQPEAWSAILHPDDLRDVLAKWEVAHSTGKPFEAEYRLKRADGMYRWHLGRSISIKEKDDTVSRWLGMATDITDQKEAEQQKDEFISIASHELKTPVTTIKGLTQLLKRKLERQGATEFVSILATMETQITRLIRLVNDLLDSSKIQAGRLDYAKEAVDLDELVRDIIETIQLTTTTHTISMHGATNASIVGDSDRLEQVFINLISNAIKYSPHATDVDIHLTVSQDMVAASIHDDGIGIPKEQQRKIFDRFFRAHDTTAKAAPGLGMGLYIASEIVKRHRGEITVISEERKGSTFTVYLPSESKDTKQ